MTRRQLLSLVVVAIVLCALPSVEAATLTVSIDGDSMDVPLQYKDHPTHAGGYFEIGNGVEPFRFETSEGSVGLEGALDPDPSLLFGSVAFDFGAPSIFGFTFILPLAPLFPNPSTVFDSFSGSVTNAGGPSVVLTAMPPAAGIPVDADGITEMQVYTLSDDGGLTWKNVGLDLGPSTTFPLPTGGSAVYGPFAAGPIPTIAGGPWTHMRADINFSLSGGGDSFTFNGAKVLVPEPGAAALALVLMGAFCCSRRFAA